MTQITGLYKSSLQNLLLNNTLPDPVATQSLFIFFGRYAGVFLKIFAESRLVREIHFQSDFINRLSRLVHQVFGFCNNSVGNPLYRRPSIILSDNPGKIIPAYTQFAGIKADIAVMATFFDKHFPESFTQ